MGTRMAPSYANIFMGELEKHLLQNTTYKPAVWWRYIDDILVLWNNGEEQLQKFLKEINALHPTNNSLLNGQEKVSFLDTTVILGETNIYTDLYTKPTDTHQYLSPMSCHPRHCTKSTPYSQSLRLRDTDDVIRAIK